MSLPSEPTCILSFKNWLSEHGGSFHPDVQFISGAHGFAVCATEDLQPDTTIVSCPFSLAITPDVSRCALTSLLGESSTAELESWSERQLICSYICLHWGLGVSSSPALAHLPYLNTLPPVHNLRTPLHFTDIELEAFKGTNLYRATLDRGRDWRAEWSQCQKCVSGFNTRWGDSFTWECYLTASTYLSSRAFPSTLLSPTPSLASTPLAHPVLLPGIDSLNHARGHPVSWVISYPGPKNENPSVEPCISLLLHEQANAGRELFNNYGTKPNSELILGYGFSLPNNPDDTIVLKVGGANKSETRKWEVGRNGRCAEGLWEELLQLVTKEASGGNGGNGDEAGYEDDLDAADVLSEMVQNLLQGLPSDWENLELRMEVKEMLEHYVEGQCDILQSIMKFVEDKERRAVERAREMGIEIVLVPRHL